MVKPIITHPLMAKLICVTCNNMTDTALAFHLCTNHTEAHPQTIQVIGSFCSPLRPRHY